jgi:hypothetical protein
MLQGVGVDECEGQKAMIKPMYSAETDYECIFIDDIARESLCCVAVSDFRLE